MYGRKRETEVYPLRIHNASIYCIIYYLENIDNHLRCTQNNYATPLYRLKQYPIKGAANCANAYENVWAMHAHARLAAAAATISITTTSSY